MKEYTSLFFGGLLLALLATSGCNLVDWGKCQFGQGCNVPQNETCVHRYIRSARVYDKLLTIGIFDVLWLSPEVQRAALDMKKMKFDMMSHEKDLALQEIVKNTEQYLSFYVLVYQAKGIGSVFTGSTAFWSLLLSVDGVLYEPVEIKEIDREDFDPVYQYYLFNCMSRQKKIFFVRFAAKQPNGMPVITPTTHEIQLCIRSYLKQVALGWTWCGNDNEFLLKAIDKNACNQTGVTECGTCALCPSHDVCKKQ